MMNNRFKSDFARLGLMFLLSCPVVSNVQAMNIKNNNNNNNNQSNKRSIKRSIVEQGSNLESKKQKISSEEQRELDLQLITDINHEPSLKDIQTLIKNRANVNARDDRGFTPLHYAAFEGNVKVVRRLIESGADNYATTTSENWTPIDLAESGGHTEVVRLLEGNTEVARLISDSLKIKEFYISLQNSEPDRNKVREITKRLSFTQE